MGRIFDANDRADDSVEGLILLCKDWIRPDTVMVEIGCYRGVSTAIFAQHAKRVYAVDPWMDNYGNYKELPRDMLKSAEPLFDKVCERYPNIEKLKGLSVDVSSTFEDEFLDAVYIDGDHSEAAIKTDLAAWVPKVRKGGLIMGHDFSMTFKYLDKVMVYPDTSWVYMKDGDIVGAHDAGRYRG